MSRHVFDPKLDEARLTFTRSLIAGNFAMGIAIRIGADWRPRIDDPLVSNARDR